MFDQQKADRAIRFIEKLRHVKGEWAGKPFVLDEWQRKIISDIFGTVDENGFRIIRTVYIEIGRKNGKSQLASAIALCLLYVDGEPGAEIYSAAGDRDQASIVFNVAEQTVNQEPALKNRSRVYTATKRIVYGNSFYRVLSSEAGTKHGFNAHGIIFDELHTQPNRDLWDVLTTSVGTRRQPLIVAITTAGFDRQSICWEVHEYARKVRDGLIVDPSFYPALFCLPENADWEDEANWHKVNPGLGKHRSLEDLRREYQKAKYSPAFVNTFRRLYLCQWTQSDERWIDLKKWIDCGNTIDPITLLKKKCWCGLDLSHIWDLSAFIMVFKIENKFQVLSHFFCPADNIYIRASRDRVPYDAWERDGYLTATPGNVIDYRFIREKINQLAKDYDIQEIAFDPYGATEIVQHLGDEDRFNMIEFRQGYLSMSPPTKDLMRLVMSGQIDHGNNPILNWMADNMTLATDPAGNVKPDKAKSREKIDGMVGLIMGLDRCLKNNMASVYDTQEVKEL